MPRFALVVMLALAGCGAEHDGLPGGEGRQPFSSIAAGERFHFTGTEPFWSGEVGGATLTYATPEEPQGQRIRVERFAGRGGLSWSGTFAGAPLVLAASQAPCSDGMSDRIYPFTVTLQVRQELRSGCGWTAARPFRGPEAP